VFLKDDTIKITGVTSVRSILRNTFSGKYKSVIGMSERYRHYESYYNATFHYLTASPDQLYPFLREFLQREKFPLGSYHMRHLTWFDINFIEFFTSKSFIKQKTKILNMFFQQTHSRKFILFGDIFQKDPEIYANIYKKYPERILKIFIRVSKKKLSNRLNQVFQYIPKYKWDVFVNGLNLPEKIF
jgi:phosphatidate phosphatase APP1